MSIKGQPLYQVWRVAGPKLINGASLQTYQEGACFEALIEGVLIAPLDSRYTQVGSNFISVQV